MTFSLPFPFGGLVNVFAKSAFMKSLTGYVNVLTKTPNKFFILVFSPVLRFGGSGIDLGCQLGFGLRFGLGIWLDFWLGFGMDFGLGFRNCNSWNLLFMWNLWTSCYIWTFSRFFNVAVGTNLLTFIHFFGVWNVIIPLWFAISLRNSRCYPNQLDDLQTLSSSAAADDQGELSLPVPSEVFLENLLFFFT